jgi:hypothetical protein
MYNGGQTWMDIAKSLNVPASVWNPTSVDTTTWTNADFTNSVWRGILQNSYMMSPEDWTYFQSQTYPLNEVVVADVYGNEVGRPVRDVYSAYSAGNNQWSSVQSSFNQTTTTTTPPLTTTTTTTTQVTSPKTTRTTYRQVTRTSGRRMRLASLRRPVRHTMKRRARRTRRARRHLAMMRCNCICNRK